MMCNRPAEGQVLDYDKLTMKVETDGFAVAR